MSTFAKKAAKNAGLSRLFSPMSSKISNEEFLHDDEHIDDIYLALKKAVDQFGPNDRIAIEITGGKKTMGVQLSNAAAALRHNQKRAVDIVYIDYDEYMPKYRKPIPETSRLLIIGDPPAPAETVFSELENVSEIQNQVEPTTDKRGVMAFPIFEGRNFPPIDDLAFILMPFGENWSDRIWKIIHEECGKQSFQAVRADELDGHKIMEDIWMSILQARVLIADITNRNPNVFYELGIGHTIGKRIILLTQNIKDMPFDLTGYRVVEYADNVDGCERLVKGLQKALSKMKK